MAVGVDPVPNYTRDVKKGIARWDAYLHVPDPDALAVEFSSRSVEFFEPLKDTDDGLRGFELQDADGYVLFFGRPRSCLADDPFARSIGRAAVGSGLRFFVLAAFVQPRKLLFYPAPASVGPQRRFF